MARTWVLVAESARARLFEVEELGDLKELLDFSHPESRIHEQKLTSDLPGRTFDRGGQGRHAMEEDTPPKRYEAEDFARELTAYLDKARAGSRFEKLVLVAEPRFLGILRDHLTGTLKKMVSGEVGKNLIQETAKNVRAQLPERL